MQFAIPLFTCFAELLLELFHQRPCRLRLGHPYFTGLIPPTHRRVQSNQPGQTTLIAPNIARRLLPRVLMWRSPPKISSLGLRVEARIQPRPPTVNCILNCNLHA